MKTYIRYRVELIVLIVLTLTINSCSDRLEVTPPNSITDEQIQEILASGDETKIQIVINGLVANLDENFRLDKYYFSGYSNHPMNSITNQDLCGDLRGNDIVLGERTLGTNDTYSQFYSLDPSFQPWLSTDRANNYTWWLLAATPHTNANKVLAFFSREIVEKSGKNINLFKDARAKCLTVRAYGYILLMERYQKAYLHGGKDGKGMPIYTKYAINDPVAPASAKETYDFIKNDLAEAVSLFGESQTGEGKDGYTVKKVSDVDRAIARYLQARVSLWTGDYETCITACQEILAHYPKLIGEAEYGVQNTRVKELSAGNEEARADDNAFTSIQKNPETFLGWNDGSGGQVYQYGNFNCFAEGNGGVNEQYMRIDDRLFRKIADNDFRKGIFLSDTVTYVYPTDKKSRRIPEYTNLKWAATVALQQKERNKEMNCDYTYLRTSEILLMLAEAQASLNRDPEAKATLNILLAARTRTGAPTLTCDNYPSMAGMTTMEMVRLQWRIEMWGECGLEYANNKRWNIDVDRSGSALHWSSGKMYSVEHMTYEIPDQELATNGHWNE